MKVKGVSNFNDQMKLFRNRVQSYGHPKYGLITAKWPRARGSKRTQGQIDNNDTFAQVVAWAKQPMASELQVAQDGTPGTGYLVRDIIESACYGKAVEALLPNGTMVIGRRVLSGSIQQLLASISTTPGDMLVCGPGGKWIALSAGAINDVITSRGPGVTPTYQPSSGGGGSQPSFWAQPIGVINTATPTGHATKGGIFQAQSDFIIKSTAATIIKQATNSLFGSIAILDGSSSSPQITAIHSGTPLTPDTSTGLMQKILTLPAELTILAGTVFAALCTASEGTGTTASPVASGTSATTIGPFPGIPLFYCYINDNSPSIGDTLTTGPLSSGPYAVGFEWGYPAS